MATLVGHATDEIHPSADRHPASITSKFWNKHRASLPWRDLYRGSLLALSGLCCATGWGTPFIISETRWYRIKRQRCQTTIPQRFRPGFARRCANSWLERLAGVTEPGATLLHSGATGKIINHRAALVSGTKTIRRMWRAACIVAMHFRETAIRRARMDGRIVVVEALFCLISGFLPARQP